MTRKSRVRLKPKKNYFVRNGAILLEKQISLRGNVKVAVPLKTYSAKKVEEAINNSGSKCFSSPSGTVYKSNLDDNVVAIKLPFDPKYDDYYDEKTVNFNLNDASTRELINHKNLLKIHGVCLETSMPILVYEFMANSSLFDRLHIRDPKNMNWSERLNIAADIAYALSYMHNALAKPIVHRDVQSANIFLEESYRAKLGNLAYSISVTPEDTSERWSVMGTPGYIDPEYVETQKVTDKCDVYGFGVLMIEILTGINPKEKSGDNGLVNQFAAYMKKDHLQIMDETMSNEGNNVEVHRSILENGSNDQAQQFAELALTCVARKGVDRPTMIEVVEELWRMQGR